ncbi:MAG: YqeG family HAD IIIA-type phosphatase [Mycoplasmatales bacterium]
MFKPNIYVNHVKNINFEKLKEDGIKLLCFDLDNTLDPADIITQEIDDEIKVVLKKIKGLGFTIFLISNNSIKNRVDSFSKLSKIEGIHGARKPFQKTYKTNKIIQSFNKNEIAFIGDKIVTDIIGGNKYGSLTILVDPLVPSKKHWYAIIMNVSEFVFCACIGFKRGEYYEQQ